MKYTSALITDGRKKLGDTVWARNPSGGYIRARVKPTNPQTEIQQYGRNQFATITKSWRTLTPSQIQGWNLLASSVTRHDSLGQSYHPSGLDLYCSCGMNLFWVGVGPIADPPTDTSIPAAPPITNLTLDTSESPALSLDFTIEGSEDNGEWFYAFYCTPGFSSGISFVAPFMYRWSQAAVGPDEDGAWSFLASPGLSGTFPTNGQKVAIGYRTISQVTGFGSKMQTASILVEGL